MNTPIAIRIMHNIEKNSMIYRFSDLSDPIELNLDAIRSSNLGNLEIVTLVDYSRQIERELPMQFDSDGKFSPAGMKTIVMGALLEAKTKAEQNLSEIRSIISDDIAKAELMMRARLGNEEEPLPFDESSVVVIEPKNEKS